MTKPNPSNYVLGKSIRNFLRKNKILIKLKKYIKKNVNKNNNNK